MSDQPETPRPRIVSVGHVTHDLYPSGIVIGGSAYFGALIYRALGANSQMVTTVGHDFVGDTAVADVVHAITRDGVTTCFQNVYRPGAPRVQRLDAMAPTVPVPALTGWGTPVDVLHLVPVIGEVDLASWVSKGPTALRAISVQGWTRAPGPPFHEVHPELATDRSTQHRSVVDTQWDPPASLLRNVDVVCVSQEDLAGQPNLLERLVATVPTVACTYHTDGADIYVDHGQPTRVGIYPTTEIDPTGAGDSFAAGFVYGLACGWSPIDAARMGAAVASIIVEEVGGRAILRVATEARERMKRIV